jgi:hypothetical protein
MSIDVQVERPVVIKANGKTIKLTNEEARELARKLNGALGIETTPRVPWYPYPPYTTWQGNDDDVWYHTSDGTALANDDITITMS